MNVKKEIDSRANDRVETKPELEPMLDPEDWEVVPEPEAIAVSTQLGCVFSVRLDLDSATLVREAARMKGVTPLEFMRHAAETAAGSIVAPEQVRHSA